jgi:hypothetical protein
MSSSSAVFDHDWNAASEQKPIRPLFTVDDLDDNKKVLEWMNNCYDVELKRASKYRETALKHIALFRGRHYGQRGSRSAESSTNGLGIASNKVSRLIINYLYDGVQQRVSRVTRNKASVTVTPANAEYEDRISAKVTKLWVDYQLYANEMDALSVEIANAAYIIGEAYPCVLWNPSKGAVHPDWKAESETAKLEKRKPRLPLKDSEGNPVLGEDGEQLWITRPVKIGDVEFSCRTPLNALPELCGNFNTRKYDILEDWHDVDELRAKYPDLAEKIVADQDYQDPLGELRQFAGHPPPDKNKVLVRTFFHRSTDFLDGGRYIVSTKDVVLENKPLEDPEQELPLARLTDIDVTGEQRGLSFFVHSKAINATLNDFVSMMRRNTVLGSHPKWLLPKGSVVKKDALGNDITSIEYTGPTEPRMVAPPPLSQEINILRKDLRDDLNRLQGVSEFMQGKVPPNIRSAMALQMVDEQDEQRANSGVTKFNKMIRDTVQKAINLASCYYEKEDKRLIPIVGRDNTYLVKQFDPDALRKPYNVRVANSSGLPSGKAAKTETLIELKKSFPALVRDEQVADMLEFSDTERFYDQASVASRAAEAENESMLNGEPVDQPVPFEHHVVHWVSHMTKIQDRGFKVATPPEVQAAMIGHTQATEYLMLKGARKNPAYSLELVALPGFPAFFDLGPIDRMILDRARSGNPLSLEELAMLDETGTIPPTAGAGITPPAGGIPNPSQNVGAPISPAIAQAAPMPPGQPQAQPPAEMAPVVE